MSRFRVTSTTLLNSLKAADARYEIVERGQDFAVLRKINPTTDVTGNANAVTNQVTWLENGIHYCSNFGV